MWHCIENRELIVVNQFAPPTPRGPRLSLRLDLTVTAAPNEFLHASRNSPTDSVRFLSNLFRLTPFTGELTHDRYEIARKSRIRPNIFCRWRKLPHEIPFAKPHLAYSWSGRIYLFVHSRGCARGLFFQCKSPAHGSRRPNG